jgi:hypothetical protein
VQFDLAVVNNSWVFLRRWNGENVNLLPMH